MEKTILKDFRKKHALSQAELGYRLGLKAKGAQGRISHYESGRRGIPLSDAYKFIDLAKSAGEEISLEDILPRPITSTEAES
jgi:transcriptional regulator with XRE-family HTH domain